MVSSLRTLVSNTVHSTQLSSKHPVWQGPRHVSLGIGCLDLARILTQSFGHGKSPDTCKKALGSAGSRGLF